MPAFTDRMQFEFSNGTLATVYTNGRMVVENAPDAESGVTMLQRVACIVSLALGRPINVSPPSVTLAKIVGNMPTRTKKQRRVRLTFEEGNDTDIENELNADERKQWNDRVEAYMQKHNKTKTVAENAIFWRPLVMELREKTRVWHEGSSVEQKHARPFRGSQILYMAYGLRNPPVPPMYGNEPAFNIAPETTQEKRTRKSEEFKAYKTYLRTAKAREPGGPANMKWVVNTYGVESINGLVFNTPENPVPIHFIVYATGTVVGNVKLAQKKTYRETQLKWVPTERRFIRNGNGSLPPRLTNALILQWARAAFAQMWEYLANYITLLSIQAPESKDEKQQRRRKRKRDRKDKRKRGKRVMNLLREL